MKVVNETKLRSFSNFLVKFQNHFWFTRAEIHFNTQIHLLNAFCLLKKYNLILEAFLTVSIKWERLHLGEKKILLYRNPIGFPMHNYLFLVYTVHKNEISMAKNEIWTFFW